jgi:hypothetical protein
MANYIEIELYGRKLRYYDETHVETEFRDIKDNWRQKPVVNRSGGYKSYQIKVDGKGRYVAIHRLVFFIHNPSWDIYDSSHDNSIDHIDGNPSNNKIENLRCVTNQENQFNREVNGCHWHKGKKKWIASIRITIALGSFNTEAEAHAAYLIGKAKHHVIAPKSFLKAEN